MFEDRYVSTEHRFSLGEETQSHIWYLAFPVTNGIVDYEEYYALTRSEYRHFLSEPERVLPLLGRCRAHQEDHRLIQPPGWNRGTPI